jgi:hypothetical protein
MLFIALAAASEAAGLRKDEDHAGWTFVFRGPEVSPGSIEGAWAKGSLRITSCEKSVVPAETPSAV